MGVGQTELEVMPEPGVLRRWTCDGQTVVTRGRSLIYRYDADDTGMRNLAIVALTDAGQRVGEVAAVFGLTATYVSMLRGRARAQGSAGLVRRRGRRSKLTDKQVIKARVWAGEGWTQQAIADRLEVSQSVISELLARRGPMPVQDALPEPVDTEPIPAHAEAMEAATGDAGDADVGDAGMTDAGMTDAGMTDAGMTDAGMTDAAGQSEPVGEAAVAVLVAGTARIGTGVYRSRYAGAMLLLPYLDRVDAETTFATLTGAPGRRYDDLAVLSTATVGFALGTGTVEGFKHLRRADAGATVGVHTVPELATLRARLGALADAGDPLATQRAFAAGMLGADPAADPIYFVDDHFVPYAGARPVAKGWNTKRRHAEPGRDDTVLVDARGRAVVFSSGEPSGLCATLPGVLAQLRQVLGPHAPVLLGFDRGGAYPTAFTACREAGAHWVTYRRAPLIEATVAPEWSSTVRDGRTVSVLLADETVTIKGYGPARQLSLFEHGAVVLQVLTSDTTATGAELLCWLRARWRIENMFKYAAAHNGIDALADYRMDLGPDPRQVTNPARTAARTTLSVAEAELAAAERALPQLLAGPGTPKQINAALPRAHRRIEAASRAVTAAKTALRPIPAKIAAIELDPNATRARPHLARRGLQMVLRLLAFNAEAWLADHLGAYLADPDEYRGITRNLLQHSGQIDYTTHHISITLDRPDSPRIARALALLTEELNNTPARLPGDRRPLTYQIAEA